jgi:hypothetical protein
MNSQELNNFYEAYLDVYSVDEKRAPGVKPYQPRKRNPLPKEKALSGEKGDGSGYGKPSPDGKDPLDTNKSDYNRFAKGLAPTKRTFGRPFGKYDPGTIKLNDILKKLPKGKNREIIRHTNLNNSYDLYDVILSHLLDEGYAETVENAEAIMVNMSEDWRESICEEYKKLPVQKMTGQIVRKLKIHDPNYYKPGALTQAQKLINVMDTHSERKAKSKLKENK